MFITDCSIRVYGTVHIAEHFAVAASEIIQNVSNMIANSKHLKLCSAFKALKEKVCQAMK